MSILTDNGLEFVGENKCEIFTEVSKSLKINKIMSNAYRPETKDSLSRERSQSNFIKEMLIHIIDQHT